MKISFTNYPIDIILGIIWSFLLIPASLFSMDRILLTILGLPVIFFIPGYTLIFLFYPYKKANKGICPYCLKSIKKGHFDHIIPVIDGGTNDKDNLLWVCAECNLKKHTKHVTEFLYEQTPVGKQARLC